MLLLQNLEDYTLAMMKICLTLEEFAKLWWKEVTMNTDSDKKPLFQEKLDFTSFWS